MKLDPRTRLLIVLLISSAAVVIKDIKLLLMVLLLTLLLCRVFSISIIGALKKLKKLWYFFIILALIQSVFTPGGEVLLRLGGIRLLSGAGLKAGISIILRMSVIIYSALIIAAAPVLQVVYGLVAMRLPYEIAFMVLLAMKFLPLFRDEFTDSMTAVQLAGADLARIPPRKKLSLYTYILMPAVIKALRRARYIAFSMESRGFRAYPDRTSYCYIRMGRADYGVIAATAAAVGLIVIFAI